MFRSICCAGLGIVVLLVSCERPPVADIETPPSPSTDPADAFPQFDVVYRNAGFLPSNGSTDGKLNVLYFRFFADGTVRRSDQLTGSDNKVTKAMSSAEFGKLAVDSGDKFALGGTYEIREGSITLTVTKDYAYQGRPQRTILSYTGQVDGDQVRMTHVNLKTGERWSLENVFWAVAP